MDVPSPHEVTRLLKAWSEGNQGALQELIPLVYDELHRVAQHHMAAERHHHTLQTTALIHEVYLRLLNVRNIDWQNRTHFVAICARLMRNTLIDLARARLYKKRGGNVQHIVYDETIVVGLGPRTDILALDDALKSLATFDERKSRVVELRFFGGLSVQETAQVLEVSSETVMRDWKLAKVWLLRELGRKAVSTKNGA
jgi:RNA polymerase sigma-70 factor (ECF subfamily)